MFTELEPIFNQFFGYILLGAGLALVGAAGGFSLWLRHTARRGGLFNDLVQDYREEVKDLRQELRDLRDKFDDQAKQHSEDWRRWDTERNNWAAERQRLQERIDKLQEQVQRLLDESHERERIIAEQSRVIETFQRRENINVNVFKGDSDA